MATHVYHEWPDGAERPVLYDGCPECAKRASEPWKLDSDNFARAWQLMVNVEHPSTRNEGRTFYRTINEAKLCKMLYGMAVLMERHMDVDPWHWPVTITAVPAAIAELLGRDSALASKKAT